MCQGHVRSLRAIDASGRKMSSRLPRRLLALEFQFGQTDVKCTYNTSLSKQFIYIVFPSRYKRTAVLELFCKILKHVLGRIKRLSAFDLELFLFLKNSHICTRERCPTITEPAMGDTVHAKLRTKIFACVVKFDCMKQNTRYILHCTFFLDSSYFIFSLCLNAK